MPARNFKASLNFIGTSGLSEALSSPSPAPATGTGTVAVALAAAPALGGMANLDSIRHAPEGDMEEDRPSKRRHYMVDDRPPVRTTASRRGKENDPPSEVSRFKRTKLSTTPTNNFIVPTSVLLDALPTLVEPSPASTTASFTFHVPPSVLLDSLPTFDSSPDELVKEAAMEDVKSVPEKEEVTVVQGHFVLWMGMPRRSEVEAMVDHVPCVGADVNNEIEMVVSEPEEDDAETDEEPYAASISSSAEDELVAMFGRLSISSTSVLDEDASGPAALVVPLPDIGPVSSPDVDQAPQNELPAHMDLHDKLAPFSALWSALEDHWRASLPAGRRYISIPSSPSPSPPPPVMDDSVDKVGTKRPRATDFDDDDDGGSRRRRRIDLPDVVHVRRRGRVSSRI